MTDATSYGYRPVLLDIRAVAHMISYGARQTQRLLNQPHAPRPVKIGTGRRWRTDEIVAWAEGLERASEASGDE